MSLPVLAAPDGAAQVVDLDTGDVYLLQEAPPTVLAQVEQKLRAMAGEAKEARDVVDAELERRMGRAKTLDAGTHVVEKVVKREWHPGDTWAALDALAHAGLVDVGEAEEACPLVEVRKPDGRKLASLLTRLLDVDADDEATALLARLRDARRVTSWLKLESTAVDGTAVEA